MSRYVEFQWSSRFDNGFQKDDDTMMKQAARPSMLLLNLLILALVFAPRVFYAQTKSEKIDALISQCYANGQFNGSALVAEHGKIIYNKAYGLANFATEEKAQPQTAYNLASVTKQFTAMAIMILRERGVLSYQDDLRKYLPALPYEGVTIRHLLTHTSGMPDYIGLFEQKWDTTSSRDERKIVSNADIIDMLAAHRPPMLFKPGERWEYSNTGYALLYSIVEKAAGESADQFLKKNIFDPLHMRRTLVYSKIKDQKIENRAFGFSMSLDGLQHRLNDLGYLDGIAGDGSIYSTTEDLFKWDQALYTEKLVKQSTLQEAFVPVRLNNDSTFDYGFGWGIHIRDGKKVVEHSGGWVGFRTVIVREIEDKNTIILLTNNSASATGALSAAISNILHDRPFEVPKKSIAQVLGKAILQKDVEAALAQYRELKERQADAYDFGERELNGLGYQLLELKKLREAIAVFSLNVETYPQSFNVYDSLGEAYMANGDKDLAIANYQKSVQLNPQNANGIAMLKKLMADEF